MINSFLLFVLSFYFISCELPSKGKFVIMKFHDSDCKSAIDVKLNSPTSPCWSTAYDNGIKPISYNETTDDMTAKFYKTNNCFSSNVQELTFKCDNTCFKNPMTDNYLKCSYVSFPSHANFTFNSYLDSECQYQTEISVLKGNSHCWTIHNGLSLTPTAFNADNYKDVSVYSYSSSDCAGEYLPVQEIECNNRCFKLNGDNTYYYRCTYIAGEHVKVNAMMLMLGILFIII